MTPLIALYGRAINSLSMRNYHPGADGALASGHDQFFSAFSRRGDLPKRKGDELAETLDGLARQNTFYLEVMHSPPAPRLASCWAAPSQCRLST